VAVTGDPDQSIYGWRGADLKNILEFEHDYPNVKIVRLERNYRSTKRILHVADQLIGHNIKRKKKELWTENGEGAAVRLVAYLDQDKEAADIAEQIREAVAEGKRKPSDFAIFYRVNALSRSVEKALRAAGVPYQMVRGQEFYARKEIKDVLAYCQLINNPRDDMAFERTINTPARGIGRKTIERLTEYAYRHGIPMLEAARSAWDIEGFSKGTAAKIAAYVEIIDRITAVVHGDLEEVIGTVLEASGYRASLAGSDDEQDQNRLANIEELLTDARQFDEQNPGGGKLEEYLERSWLVNDTDNWDAQTDKATLMTLHAAKGLEFPLVFLAGMEEGLFPSSRTLVDPNGLEEERRLCYVGMTRAREQLWCVHCLERRLHGQFREQSPSPFITEIPEDVREEVRMARARYVPEAGSWRERPMGSYDRYGDRYSNEGRRAPSYGRPTAPARPAPPRPVAAAPPPQPRKNDSVNGVLSFFKESPVQFDPAALRPATPQNAPSTDFKRAQRVRHEQFGDGTILTMEGSGPDAKLTVYFDRIGSKKFIAKYAKLIRI
jgi:DNA helicase II / ATP-dependent DNA helicase PcrA